MLGLGFINPSLHFSIETLPSSTFNPGNVKCVLRNPKLFFGLILGFRVYNVSKQWPGKKKEPRFLLPWY
jgi:hypothetical protein